VFGLGPATRIYVALGATDMRKGYDGLYGLVRDKLGLEVRTGHLFLFANARRNRLKIFTGMAPAFGAAPNGFPIAMGVYGVSSLVPFT
jgi:hypothetical protein